MKYFLPLLIPTIITSISFNSCTKKPTACINSVSQSVNVGDTIKVTSCSQNASTYIWEVNGNSLNRVDDPYLADFCATDGGFGCEDWVNLKFYKAGTYEVKLTNPVLTKGICSSSSKSWSKQDKTSINIKVN